MRLSGVGQSATALTLARSICTLPGATMKPRNETVSAWNTFFSALTYKWCSRSLWLWCRSAGSNRCRGVVIHPSSPQRTTRLQLVTRMDKLILLSEKRRCNRSWLLFPWLPEAVLKLTMYCMPVLWVCGKLCNKLYLSHSGEVFILGFVLWASCFFFEKLNIFNTHYNVYFQ